MSGRRIGIPALLAAIALAASCARLPGGGRGADVTSVERQAFGRAEPRGGGLDRDAVWSGEVRVDGAVHVRKGATLTILPGTRVAFVPGRVGTADEHEGFAGPGIRVEGRIVAEGTEGKPILFTTAGTSRAPGSWDKVLFSFGAGSRFDNCTFEGARYALHAHFSEISVRRCPSRDNDEGVRLGQSRVSIADSVFTRNEVRGINFRECRNEIRGNLVYGNGDGIFLHSKDSGSVIRGNAVYGNRGFDPRLGDLHAEDIDASGNWWETPREDEARRKVFDGRNLSGLGAVRPVSREARTRRRQTAGIVPPIVMVGGRRTGIARANRARVRMKPFDGRCGSNRRQAPRTVKRRSGTADKRFRSPVRGARKAAGGLRPCRKSSRRRGFPAPARP